MRLAGTNRQINEKYISRVSTAIHLVKCCHYDIINRHTNCIYRFSYFSLVKMESFSEKKFFFLKVSNVIMVLFAQDVTITSK